MRLTLMAAALAAGLLLSACGGGGGGGTNSNSGGSGPSTPTTPSTSLPVVDGVATVSGNRGDYTITRTSAGVMVTNKLTRVAAPVTGARALRFSDVTVNLAISAKAAAFGPSSVQALVELYMAFHNRVPEADTLSTWIDRMAGGQTLTQIADSLYAEAVRVPDVSGYNTSMVHTEYVTAVYKYVFGRFGATAPTAAQVQTWSSRIDKGGNLSRGALVIAMLEAARTGISPELSIPEVVLYLANKITVGEYFAVQHGINYNTTDESVRKTKDIAAAITATDFSAAMTAIGFSDTTFTAGADTK